MKAAAALVLLVALPGNPHVALATAAPDSVAAPPATFAAPADSTSPVRVVRRFPPIVVTAPLHDMRSSETVHVVSGSALHALPVDDFADAIALQPGVVAQAGELHVRGGRSGETTTYLDGLRLDDPRRGTAMEVPLLALRGADLVSGAPEAQYGAGLAGTLDLQGVNPGGRFSGESRWQTSVDDTAAFDRVSARIDVPLPRLGLGLVAAGDGTLDDTALPNVRSADRLMRVAGRSLNWRAENRLLGWAKLAPTDQSRRLVAEVLVNRRRSRPFDPAWSRDGWMYTMSYPGLGSGPPIYSPIEVPGAVRYRAADHLAITDDRRLAASISSSYLSPARRGTIGLGWLRARTVTSVGGGRGHAYLDGNSVFYSRSGILAGDVDDPYYVIWGDYPLYRESGSDAVSLRADGERTTRGGGILKAGAGASLEHVTLYELDSSTPGTGFDSLRTYHATAPGAYAYVQDRWGHEGLVVNAGLRAEYFTPGAAGKNQTLPWDGRGLWSLSPRLGISYPVSVRDVLSLAYVRAQQDPGRDYLYDTRHLPINARRPLGNPGLIPATVISYEGSVKHLFSPAWALQGALFFRNVWNEVGVRDYYYGYHSLNVTTCYASDDAASAVGSEWSLLYASGAGRRFELHYTWMRAMGYESRAEGDSYGAPAGWRVTPTFDVPLSWDRHHSIVAGVGWQMGPDLSVAWSTAVGSPLPWTPEQRRTYLTDLGLVDSRRLGWTEVTNLDVYWMPRWWHALELGFEVRNLFDGRSARLVTLDGYPNPVINTAYDDYGAYRTETGQGGGAYWMEPPDGSAGYWVPVNDPRLTEPPRTLRVTLGVRW